VRVVIAEDSVILREGLARILADEGFEVMSVGGPDELLECIERQPPDVAIVDVRMPPTYTDEGIRAAIEIRRRGQATPLLLFSQYIETTRAVELLRGGSSGFGYLLKDRVLDVADFVDAVRRVGSGGTALDPEVVAQLLGRRGASPLEALTPREQEVMKLIAEGRSNAAIASTLVLSVGAVEKHIASIFQKLRLPPSEDDHRRVLAVLAYLEGYPRAAKP